MRVYEGYCSIVAADSLDVSRRGIIVGPGQWTWGAKIAIHYIAEVGRLDWALFAMDVSHLGEYRYERLVSTRRFFLEAV